MLGISVLGFLGNQTRLVKANLFPTPLLQGEQLLVQLDRPPLPIPDPSDEVLTKEELLNKKRLSKWFERLSTAAALVQTMPLID